MVLVIISQWLVVCLCLIQEKTNTHGLFFKLRQLCLSLSSWVLFNSRVFSQVIEAHKWIKPSPKVREKVNEDPL